MCWRDRLSFRTKYQMWTDVNIVHHWMCRQHKIEKFWTIRSSWRNEKEKATFQSSLCSDFSFSLIGRIKSINFFSVLFPSGFFSSNKESQPLLVICHCLFTIMLDSEILVYFFFSLHHICVLCVLVVFHLVAILIPES